MNTYDWHFILLVLLPVKTVGKANRETNRKQIVKQLEKQ